ncbi:MAG: hypothetical protein ACOX3T_04905 [Bdellovibrionota bacterium]
MARQSFIPQHDPAYDIGKSYDPVSELMRAIVLRAIEDYKSGGHFKKRGCRIYV